MGGLRGPGGVRQRSPTLRVVRMGMRMLLK